MAELRDYVGQQLGNYRLIRLIGQGGFADVYLGEHISLNTLVATKILHTELAGEDVEKFLTQARTVSSLDHPHIARVLEFGVESSTPFLIMDYAPNGSLRQLHPKGTRLPLTTVVSYVKQIAEALQYIHDQNLVHRDIKPHNMLLGPNHEVMLSDFGIAAVAQSMGYRRQKIQEFEGTILYAAPEQIRGRPRIASDQYALAVVVYEWLTGSWPFQGTVEEVASQHALVPPPPLHEKVPTISFAVEQTVLKALAKDPGERFENVEEFAKALERASRLEQSSMSIRQPTPHPLPPLSPRPLSPLPQQPAKTPFMGESVPTSHVALLAYRGHSDRIHMLAWSPAPQAGLPNGQQIASSGLDETVQIWDSATGEKTIAYQGNSLYAHAIAWSRDGKFIATTSGLVSDTVQILDVSTGHQSAKYANYADHAERIQAIAWSPDGKLIASASDDATVRVWEAATGRTIYTYRGHSLSVTSVKWSPDGKRIASGSEDKTVQVWDPTTGANILVYYAHRDKVNSVAWSPGSTHVASASDDATVQVWDGSTGRKVFTYSGHAGGVTSVSWSPDGIRITSGSLDETAQVYHAITGNTLFTYSGHSDWVSTVAWSPDGKYIASGSWDKTVQVWELK